jgi:murein DD-endopeptidase MepM/ murein hydrolase activator NlpD
MPDVLPPGCTGGASGETLPGGWALPGPRALLDATADQLDNPHHDYPAWDWIIPTGTPVYAIRGGTVVNVQAWPHNWWEQGCRQRGVNGCATCGIGVTILDPTDNTRWTYCHGSNLHITQGAHVQAGQLLITSGNTGRSGTPHLHLEIRTADGVQRCPQRLLSQVLAERSGIDPRQLAVAGCVFWPVAHPSSVPSGADLRQSVE